MNTEATIGLLIIGGIVVGGLLTPVLLDRLAMPVRVRLFEMGQAIIEDPRTNRKQRDAMNVLLDNALSFRAGWIVPHASYRALMHMLRNGRTAPTPQPRGELGEKIVALFVASILFANPFAFLASIPFALALLIVSMVEHQRAKYAFSQQARTIAVAKLQPCFSGR